ncbi:MAG: sulfotransferase domain-containing protein [Gemmatimonadaceae bacterium]
MKNHRSEPDFLCIGMQKAGTGWLYDSLRLCPGYQMPPIKELHFFDLNCLEREVRIGIDADNWTQCRNLFSVTEKELSANPLDNPYRTALRRDREFAEGWVRFVNNGHGLDDYCALFSSKGSAVSGDITPAYSMLSDAEISSIRSELPRLKIILLVRDPIGRAWSAFNMYVRGQLLSKEERKGSNVVRCLREKTTLAALEQFMALPGTRLRSFPSVTFSRWKSVFGERQLHVAFFQDIIDRPAGLIEDISSFLGVKLESPPVPAGNKKAKRPPAAIGDEHLAFLREYFLDEYRTVRALFPECSAEWLI